MKVKNHIVCKSTEALISLLLSLHINFNTIDKSDGEYIIFNIYSDDNSYDTFLSLLPRDVLIIQQIEYTKSEIETAKWLVLKCFNYNINLQNEDISFKCDEWIDCNRARHRFRSGKPFYLKSEPRWSGSHCFGTSYAMGEFELFCNSLVKRKLERYYNDLLLEQVLNLKSGIPLEDVFFIDSKNIISENFLILDESKKSTCLECGKVKYEIDDTFKLIICEDALNPKNNFYKTSCIFGGGNYQYPLTIISNEVYQYLKKFGMTKSLKFAPVVISH